jgi:flagellar biosynthesis GTPase FlhF
MPDEVNPPATTDEAQDAETTETTATLSPEDLTRELEKTRKEAARYRTKLREREEAEKAAAEQKRKAEQTAEERAAAAEKRAEEAMAAAEHRILTAERKAALAGKITNADRVLKLMDDVDAYFDGATPDVDAILRDFPEYAPKQAAGVNIPGARTSGEPSTLRPEDFKGKSQAWIAENLHRLKPPTH